jgi:hypothetical protein
MRSALLAIALSDLDISEAKNEEFIAGVNDPARGLYTSIPAQEVLLRLSYRRAEFLKPFYRLGCRRRFGGADP